MKNLSAISKKGVIVISAVIMIIAGALVVLLPSTSRAHMSKSFMGSGDGCVYVPILNNTGETLTIRGMYIDTPDYTYYHHHEWVDGELRVKAITFAGVNFYSETTSGYSHCHRHGDVPEKIINHNYYAFSGTKVECIITFDVDQDDLPSGTYTIRYYFKYDDDAEEAEDRTNTVTFTLP